LVAEVGTVLVNLEFYIEMMLESGNTLFIRDYALVLENLASSPKIRVLNKEF